MKSLRWPVTLAVLCIASAVATAEERPVVKAPAFDAELAPGTSLPKPQGVFPRFVEAKVEA